MKDLCPHEDSCNQGRTCNGDCADNVLKARAEWNRRYVRPTEPVEQDLPINGWTLAVAAFLILLAAIASHFIGWGFAQ